MKSSTLLDSLKLSATQPQSMQWQDSGGKRQLDLVCPGKVPAAGRKDKVMRFLGLAPPNGSPYATTRAVNPNLLLLSQTGDAYHCP